MSNHQIDKDIEKNKILVLLYNYYKIQDVIKPMLRTALNKQEHYEIDIKPCQDSYNLLCEIIARAKEYNEIYSDSQIKNIEKSMSSNLDDGKKCLENIIKVYRLQKLKEENQ